MTTIFEVPAIVKKVASLDLSGPVRPIGEDVYKTAPSIAGGPEPTTTTADTLRLATIARDGIMRRIERLMDAGLTDTSAFKSLVASLAYYNDMIQAAQAPRG